MDGLVGEVLEGAQRDEVGGLQTPPPFASRFSREINSRAFQRRRRPPPHPRREGGEGEEGDLGVGGGEVDAGRLAGLAGLLPADGAEAPEVTRPAPASLSLERRRGG